MIKIYGSSDDLIVMPEEQKDLDDVVDALKTLAAERDRS